MKTTTHTRQIYKNGFSFKLKIRIGFLYMHIVYGFYLRYIIGIQYMMY